VLSTQLIIFSFLIGGIPWAWLIVLLILKTDVRKHGSGNVGATNAARCFPKRYRLLAFSGIFLLDAAKGYFAAGVLPAMLDLAREPWPAMAGFAAVLGHVFTPFLKTLGGKGVATTVGVLFALEPLAAAIAVGAFFVVYAATRVVALGSIALAVALPIATWLHGTSGAAVLGLTIALAAVVVIRHSSNISKLVQGSGR
jgi:glycerol-3-phosphate acyltransferase PlsY